MSTAPAVAVRVGVVPPGNLNTELNTEVWPPEPSWMKAIVPERPAVTLETFIVVMSPVKVTPAWRKVEKSKEVVVP